MNKAIFGIIMLSGLASVASAASDAVRLVLERAARFEHAEDRRGAIEALRVRMGISRAEWSMNLFEVATNGNNRLLLQDMAGYATTNSLPVLKSVIDNPANERKFRLAAFRAYATADAFGERTLSVIQEQPVSSSNTNEIVRSDLIRQVRMLLPANDMRRIVLEQQSRPQPES